MRRNWWMIVGAVESISVTKAQQHTHTHTHIHTHTQLSFLGTFLFQNDLLACSVFPVSREKIRMWPFARRQPHSVSNLYVSGPLNFRLVIQVLLRPCMILIACIHRRHSCNVPCRRQGNRGQVSFQRIHRVLWIGVESTTLGLWVWRAIH